MANVVELADFLFANMDESGTNNDEIIHRLSVLTSEQRNILKHTFQEKYSEDLAEKLQKEFSEDELESVEAFFNPKSETDAKLLNKSMKGYGTNENLLSEIICSRRYVHLLNVQEEYKRIYNTSLQDDIAGDTSGDYMNFLLALLNKKRSKTKTPEKEMCEKSATELKDALDNNVGNKFIEVFSEKSVREIIVICRLFEKNNMYSIIESLSQTSLDKDFINALEVTIKCLITPAEYFANKIHEAIESNDNAKIQSSLIRTLLVLEDKGMDLVGKYYKNLYGTDLNNDLQRDDYSNFQKFVFEVVSKELKPKENPNAEL